MTASDWRSGASDSEDIKAITSSVRGLVGEPPITPELVLKLGMEIVRLAGVAGSTLSAKQTVQRHLTDGSALEKFKDMIKAQGGIWPSHCVADTDGAGFHPELRMSQIRHVVSKAVTNDSDAYSGFQGTDLARLLQTRNIRRVFVCGLATDYCVKATALDARHAGLDVVVIEDAIRGVEVHPGDCAAALAEMRAAGIAFACAADLIL